MITNLQQIRRAHEEILRKTDVAISRALDVGGSRIVSRARATAPRRTGVLANANEFRVVKTARGHLLRIQNTAPHAKFVEEGTKPHEITPKNAQALRFEIGGLTVFAKRVMHPGTRPTFFLRSSVQSSQATITVALQRALRQAAQ